MTLHDRAGPTRIVARSIREQVYDQLKSMILEGRFGADDRFDLNQLARDLGVSKTPLNEAVQKLESEGLLVVRPRSGTYVNSFDETEFREAFEVRRMLEIGAAEFVIGRMCEEACAEITAIAAQMKHLLETGEYRAVIREFIALDDRFHARILESSRHGKLIETYKRINTLLLVSKVRGRFNRLDSLETLVEHLAICSALEACNVEAYRQAIGAHLDASIDRLSRAIRAADSA